MFCKNVKRLQTFLITCHSKYLNIYYSNNGVEIMNSNYSRVKYSNDK